MSATLLRSSEGSCQWHPSPYCFLLPRPAGLWADVSAVPIARTPERHGVRMPFPFLGLFVLRNLHLCAEVTRCTTSRIGSLYYSFVVPFNAALVLAVAALMAGQFGW